jgi:hypothetical protein
VANEKYSRDAYLRRTAQAYDRLAAPAAPTATAKEFAER